LRFRHESVSFEALTIAQRVRPLSPNDCSVSIAQRCTIRPAFAAARARPSRAARPDHAPRSRNAGFAGPVYLVAAEAAAGPIVRSRQPQPWRAFIRGFFLLIT
jgi:hypothetical protein